MESNTKKGTFHKTKLPSVACGEIDLLKSDPNLQFLSVCLEFRTQIEIGEDQSLGTKKYIQAEVLPCQSDCLTYPSDPGYLAAIGAFLKDSLINTRVTNAKSNFKQYNEPFSRI